MDDTDLIHPEPARPLPAYPAQVGELPLDREGRSLSRRARVLRIAAYVGLGFFAALFLWHLPFIGVPIVALGAVAVVLHATRRSAAAHPVSVLLLVTSSVAFLMASLGDLVLELILLNGGTSAKVAASIMALAWVASAGLWALAVARVVRNKREGTPSWRMPLLVGFAMGAVQVSAALVAGIIVGWL